MKKITTYSYIENIQKKGLEARIMEIADSIECDLIKCVAKVNPYSTKKLTTRFCLDNVTNINVN